MVGDRDRACSGGWGDLVCLVREWKVLYLIKSAVVNGEVLLACGFLVIGPSSRTVLYF